MEISHAFENELKRMRPQNLRLRKIEWIQSTSDVDDDTDISDEKDHSVPGPSSSKDIPTHSLEVTGYDGNESSDEDDQTLPGPSSPQDNDGRFEDSIRYKAKIKDFDPAFAHFKKVIGFVNNQRSEEDDQTLPGTSSLQDIEMTEIAGLSPEKEGKKKKEYQDTSAN